MAEVVTAKAAGTAGGLGSDLITKRWPPVWWRCGPPTSHVSAVPPGAKPALPAQAHVVITANPGAVDAKCTSIIVLAARGRRNGMRPGGSRSGRRAKLVRSPCICPALSSTVSGSGGPKDG